MKRLALAAIVVATIAAPGISGAEHGGDPFSVSGTVDQPNLLATAGEAYASQAAACDPEGAANGVDGIWYDIRGFAGHTATLTPTGPTGLLEDFDASFYKLEGENCVGATLVPTVDSNMAEAFVAATSPVTGDAVEVGVVPADAQFIFVAYFFGLPGGTFTLAIP